MTLTAEKTKRKRRSRRSASKRPSNPKLSPAAILAFITAAKDAGLPQEQIINFAKARYIPQPKQMEFHYWCRRADHAESFPGANDAGPVRIGFGGARGPGKSHASFAQIALDDCQRMPGLKVLFLRNILKAAAESFQDLRQKTLFAIPHVFKTTSSTIYFPNGSRILMGGFRVESDIDKYIGIEYDVMVIEEATQLTQQKLDLLFGSLRTSKKNWRPRAYMTTNPGNIGHGDFKRLFIFPMRENREGRTKFIQANVYDNKFVDPGYLQYLEGLSGWMRKAWLEGSWEIAAGTFFTNWDENIHVIPNFIREGLPLGHEYWLAIDYGYNHWCVVYLMARNMADGVYTVVDEMTCRFSLVPEISSRIYEMIDSYGPDARPHIGAFYGSPDLGAKRGGLTDQSIADQFQEYGLNILPAMTDRVNGAAKILQLLGNPSKGILPRLFVTDRCTMLRQTLPNLIHDIHRPEDVLKVDSTERGLGGDDAYESLRYGIMSYTGATVIETNSITSDYRG